MRRLPDCTHVTAHEESAALESAVSLFSEAPLLEGDILPYKDTTKSRNREWGFYGGAVSHYGSNDYRYVMDPGATGVRPGPKFGQPHPKADAAYAAVHRHLMDAGHFKSPGEARDFLDSPHGRHIADQIFGSRGMKPRGLDATVHYGAHSVADEIAMRAASFKAEPGPYVPAHPTSEAVAQGMQGNGTDYSDDDAEGASDVEKAEARTYVDDHPAGDVRQIVKARIPTVSVRRGQGTSYGWTHITGSGVDGFTDAEREGLKGMGLHPGGNFAGMDSSGARHFIVKHGGPEAVQRVKDYYGDNYDHWLAGRGGGTDPASAAGHAKLGYYGEAVPPFDKPGEWCQNCGQPLSHDEFNGNTADGKTCYDCEDRSEPASTIPVAAGCAKCGYQASCTCPGGGTRGYSEMDNRLMRSKFGRGQGGMDRLRRVAEPTHPLRFGPGNEPTTPDHAAEDCPKCGLCMAGKCFPHDPAIHEAVDPFGGRYGKDHPAYQGLAASIEHGDRVTIVNRFGQERAGRATLAGPAGWVLNMGGAHGTPDIAHTDNVTKVRKAKAKNEATESGGPGSFDIASGHYWWLADHHGGQSSPEYARLSKMSGYYRPSPLANGPDTIEAQEVYNRLCDKHGCTHDRAAKTFEGRALTYGRNDVFKGGPGLRGYAYNADMYCGDCARKLPFGEGPWDDVDFGDSEKVPQPAFFPEADTAQHCAGCGEYLYGPKDEAESVRAAEGVFTDDALAWTRTGVDAVDKANRKTECDRCQHRHFEGGACDICACPSVQKWPAAKGKRRPATEAYHGDSEGLKKLASLGHDMAFVHSSAFGRHPDDQTKPAYTVDSHDCRNCGAKVQMADWPSRQVPRIWFSDKAERPCPPELAGGRFLRGNTYSTEAVDEDFDSDAPPTEPGEVSPFPQDFGGEAGATDTGALESRVLESPSACGCNRRACSVHPGQRMCGNPQSGRVVATRRGAFVGLCRECSDVHPLSAFATAEAVFEDGALGEADAQVLRRTFAAKEHPPGSEERAAFNRDAQHSEYYTSHRYLVRRPFLMSDGTPHPQGAFDSTFRTRAEAEAYASGTKTEAMFPAKGQHMKDSDCTVGPDDACTECGVDHSGECFQCHGRGFHKDGCPDSDATDGPALPFGPLGTRPQPTDGWHADVYPKRFVESNFPRTPAVDLGDGVYLDHVGMDPNGNHSVWVSRGANRGRKIQTNQNLPITHRLKYKDDIAADPEAVKEILSHVRRVAGVRDAKTTNEDALAVAESMFGSSADPSAGLPTTHDPRMDVPGCAAQWTPWGPGRYAWMDYPPTVDVRRLTLPWVGPLTRGATAPAPSDPPGSRVVGELRMGNWPRGKPIANGPKNGSTCVCGSGLMAGTLNLEKNRWECNACYLGKRPHPGDSLPAPKTEANEACDLCGGTGDTQSPDVRGGREVCPQCDGDGKATLTTGPPYHAGHPAVQAFLKNWHEAGRARFERDLPSLDYDSPRYIKSATNRAKYVALDAGAGEGRSGAFMLDRQTGELFGVKAYGRPHLDKRYGTIEEPAAESDWHWKT